MTFPNPFQQPPQFAQPQPPQQFVQPQYPPQFAPQPQQWAPQQFAPQPVAEPLPQGTLADFYGQPASGGAPAISWKDQPIGYGVAFVVERDVVASDVVAKTDPITGVVQRYKDGRPKYQMAVPILVQPDPLHPEGKARLFVGGQLRDELSRAMLEAGATPDPSFGAPVPHKGDAGYVQLVQRKPMRQGNPQNIFAGKYQVASPGAQAPAPEPSVPAQQPPQAQPIASPQQDAAIAQALAAAQAQAAAQTAAPVQAPAGPPPPVAGPVPTPGQPPVVTLPTGLSAEAEAVFAKLAAQNPANQ
jgi:hypothetical protein